MFSLHPLIGLFRRLRFLILRRDVQIVGQCKLCGACCRSVLLKHNGRWIRREKQFKQLVAEDPVHECFRHKGDDGAGHLTFSCRMLGDDNTCTSYDSRPALCSNYPTKSLYYCGGWIREDCGYSFKTVTFMDVLMRREPFRASSFSNALEQELEQGKDRQ